MKLYQHYPSACNQRLHEEGQPTPRTCALCKLGPCHGERPASATPKPAPSQPVVSDLGKRIGTFVVSDATIDRVFKGDAETTTVLSELMSRCVIVHAEHRLDMRGMRYVAMCPDFEPIELGMEPTRYYWNVTREQELPPHGPAAPCAHSVAGEGYFCTRKLGHEGPCAAHRVEPPVYKLTATRSLPTETADTFRL